MRDFAAIKTDTLSGFTVALALVPEAIAFAFVAAVEPLVGLYAAFIVGLITALFGGRPGMISGATGALAVVVTALVVEHGVEYLFATVILMGLIQGTAGICKLGKFIRMVPHPVMLGFVNGLAIVIFLSQLRQFGMDDGPGFLAKYVVSQFTVGYPLVTPTRPAHDARISRADHGNHRHTTPLYQNHPGIAGSYSRCQYIGDRV